MMLLDELGELGLVVDRDAVRVELPGQGRRVLAVVDVGDLGGREGYDLVVLVVAKVSVEVVKVAACGSHDQDLRCVCHAHSSGMDGVLRATILFVRPAEGTNSVSTD